MHLIKLALTELHLMKAITKIRGKTVTFNLGCFWLRISTPFKINKKFLFKDLYLFYNNLLIYEQFNSVSILSNHPLGAFKNT